MYKWEEMDELLYKQNYKALIEYCKEALKRYPDEYTIIFRLGEAYVSEKEYTKAIGFMTPYYKEEPDNIDYQHIILDALFESGKTEKDFEWITTPSILHMSKEVIDDCYDFLRSLRSKEKAMDIAGIYINCFISEQKYLTFKEEDLFSELQKDDRFIIYFTRS